MSLQLRKISWSFLAILYVLFGALQYNDPDWYIWIPVYVITAYFLFGESRRREQNPMAFYFFVILIIWWLLYIPDVIQWFQDGMPSITGSMKAESMYIELVREFFGLFICIIVMIPIAFRKKIKI